MALAQTLAPGETLRARVDREGPLSVPKLVAFAERLLETLIYLQGLNPPVVHRDVKPTNVLVDGDRVHVVDFGSVRAAFNQVNEGGSTIVGTFGYMAPEQFRGVCTKATDVYGVAATLLFAASGADPCEFPQSRMKVDISELELPSWLSGWLKTALEPHEEDRFRSAQHALQRLKRSRVAGAAAPAAQLLKPRVTAAVPGHFQVAAEPHQVVIESPTPPLLTTMARIGALLAVSMPLMLLAALTLAFVSFGSLFVFIPGLLGGLIAVLLASIHKLTLRQTIVMDIATLTLTNKSWVSCKTHRGALHECGVFSSRVRHAYRKSLSSVGVLMGDRDHSFGHRLTADEREALVAFMAEERTRLRRRRVRVQGPAKEAAVTFEVLEPAAEESRRLVHSESDVELALAS